MACNLQAGFRFCDEPDASTLQCPKGSVKEGRACIPCQPGSYEVEHKLCQKVGSLFYIDTSGASSDPSDWKSCDAFLPNSQYGALTSEPQCASGVRGNKAIVEGRMMSK